MDRDLEKLVNSYRRVFNSAEGEVVLEDLRRLSSIDEQAGSELTHSQCTYRNAMQDVYRYIEAIISED
mgnify:CR=1 FL=1